MRPRTRTRSTADGPPGHPALLWGIGTAVVASVTAFGLALTTTTDGGSQQHTCRPDTPTTAGEHASTPHFIAGVPVDYPHTRQGAKAAAANFTTVRGSTSFLTDTAARHKAVAAMITSGSAKKARAESDRSAKKAATALTKGSEKSADPKSAIARTGVLSETVTSFDIHSATVQVWTTTVRGSAKSLAPRVGFESVAVNLTWEKGDWKASSVAPGKGLRTPVSTQQTASPAADFADYTAKSAVDPVFRGGTASGLPRTYPAGESGARAAAANAVTLQSTSRFFLDSSWREHVLKATTDPSTLHSVTEDADSTAQLITTNRQLGENGKTADGASLIMRSAVLGSRTLSHTSQAASIELWTASVGGLAGQDEMQRPQVSFQRTTVELNRSSGTWKARSISPSEDLVPTSPVTEPASPAQSFTDVGGGSDAAATS